MNIEILARVSVSTPASGYGNLFLDSDNSNSLTYKDSLGDFHVINGSNCCCDDDCACELATKITEEASCLANKGVLTGAEYISIIQSLNIVSTSYFDEKTQTCTKTITNVPPVI